jgi:hypothetical protein
MTGPVVFLLFAYAVACAAAVLTIKDLATEGQRRFQFNLRMLLVVMTIFAMLLASHISLLDAIKSQK